MSAARHCPVLLEEEYLRRCSLNTDIHEHLPTLRRYASMCDHITEFGVRAGNSTFAFLAAQPRMLVSYDIEPFADEALATASRGQTDFVFRRADTTTMPTITSTDLLFIDTLHTYEQMQQELSLHASQAQRFLILHDTVAFGDHGEHGCRGILPAIEEFVAGGAFAVRERLDNNNGLMILERK